MYIALWSSNGEYAHHEMVSRDFGPSKLDTSKMDHPENDQKKGILPFFGQGWSPK